MIFNNLSVIEKKRVILWPPIYMYNNFVVIINVIINIINLKLNDLSKCSILDLNIIKYLLFKMLLKCYYEIFIT